MIKSLLSLLVVSSLVACDQGPFLSFGAGGAAGTSAAAGASSTGGAGGAGGAGIVSALYPTPRVLVERAVAPSCANGVACHQSSGRAFPPLETVDDLVATFGARCQPAAPDPRVIVDFCEPEADRLRFAGAVVGSFSIVGIDVAEAEPSPPAEVTLRFAEALPAKALLEAGPSVLTVSIARSPRAGSATPADLSISSTSLSIDMATPTVAKLSLAGLPDDTRALFDERVYPRPEGAVLVGDPNRNGVQGAALGGREASPGDLSRSFLFQRLLGDTLGPRMPLVVGAWTDTETRAMGCFLRAPVGPDEAIAYAACPNEWGGQTGVDVGTVLATQCATAACHSPSSPSVTPDLTPDAGLASRLVGVASEQAAGRVLVDHDHVDDSYLLCKINPTCATRQLGQMPKDGAPLSDDARAAIRSWIESGTPNLATSP